MTIADSMIVSSLLSNSGKQSIVYLAKKWGKTFVVKLYKNGWHQNSKIKNYLLNVNHPNIASIIDSGEYNGSYYEVYDYYNEGTLEDTNIFSLPHITNVIIPSINEGLKELHKNGIVHCDIKPGNLFYGEEKNRVIIGDCGISGFANAAGNMIDTFRGTPEYAPPVRSVMWAAEYTPAYDYGAFGLVLCRLILGHSLFEGVSTEAIAKAWANGIKLPSQISGRIEVLIKGLINPNENERWSYNEVKRWSEGEYMRPVRNSFIRRRIRNKEKNPLVFGKFNNDILKVNTLSQLSKAIRTHWDQATRVIKRSELIDFLRQFHDEKPDLLTKVQKLALYQDLDVAVFKLLSYLEPDESTICFCGDVYLNMSDYIARLSAGDMIAKKFLSSGLLIYYLREQNANKQQVDRLEQLIKNKGVEDMAAISTICFAIQNKKSIDFNGQEIKNMDDLIIVFSSKSLQQISQFIETDSFKAWLFSRGFEKESRKMNDIGDD